MVGAENMLKLEQEGTLSVEEKPTLRIKNNVMRSKPMKDRFFQIPERLMLYAFRLLSYNALKLFVVLAGQKDQFIAEEKLIIDRTGLDNIEFYKSKEELIKFEFLYISTENEWFILTPPACYMAEYDGQKKEVISFSNLGI